jgi:hypothetical protein
MQSRIAGNLLSDYSASSNITLHFAMTNPLQKFIPQMFPSHQTDSAETFTDAAKVLSY